MATAQAVRQATENAARIHHQELVAVNGMDPEHAVRVTRIWLLLRGLEPDVASAQFWHDLGTPVVVEECEHGMAAWLCAGPQHYPYDL